MSLASVVSKFSPIIGTVLNTFLPGSGLVIDGLAHLFGSSSNPDDLASAISADPDAGVKIRQFEIEHQDILAKMTQADRASAREMNVETTKSVGKSDWMMHFLGLASFVGCALYLSTDIFFHSYFDVGIFRDLLQTEMMVFSFYFGGMYVQKGAALSAPILPPPAQTR